MKQVTSIFNNTIIRFQYNEPLSDLQKTVDAIFDNFDIGDNIKHYEGKIVSTFGSKDLNIQNSVFPIKGWISDCFLESAVDLGYTGATKVNIINIFSNKMWPESAGSVHHHPETFHGVAIFYLQCPPDSSDLYIVPNGFMGATEKDFEPSDLAYLDVKQGDLIIHNPLAWHGVTKNTSKENRIVLVFEFQYE
jgi:hypothetical protein